MPLSADDISLRNMCSEDLTAIAQIEQVAQISPWARLSFEESLTRGNYCRTLLGPGEEVLAYHVVSMVLNELHVLNVVCAPKAQGLGLGHALMADIIEYAEGQTLTKIFLEVRASNTVAQNLYKKWGFKQIALRRRYYRPDRRDGEREDAQVYLREC